VAERSADWLRQAEADLNHARHANDDEDYDWAAFAAHQAAEKAIKALFQKLHLDVWGHVLSILLANLPVRPGATLIDRAKELDKHYVGARCPGVFPQGTPVDFYTLNEAERAIANAVAVVGFCREEIGKRSSARAVAGERQTLEFQR
jgi:HEPN domain-containing protein